MDDEGKGDTFDIEGNDLLAAKDGQGAIVDWLPFLRISDSGLWLGLDKEREWILGRRDGTVVRSSSDHKLPQPWLTILDSDQSDFWERFLRAASSRRLPAGELQKSIPVDDIIVLALQSHSPHWAERAMRWLIGREARHDQLALLREVSTSQWATQWTRQAAQKFLSSRG